MNATKKRFTVEHLEQDHGERGWSWTISWTDPSESDTRHHPGTWYSSQRHYRTNIAGEGLFILGSDDDWHQLDGTCDFRLAGNASAVRRVIRRRFRDV